MVSPELINHIEPFKDRDLGYHVLPKLVGRMRGYIIEDMFRDVGTPDDLAIARKEWKTASRQDGSGKKY